MESFEIKAGGGAFGDGQHPTTQLLLAALEAIDHQAFQPRSACDMGAGSGILSFAIAAKFRCPVVAVDIERQAIETLQENAVHNGLEKQIIPVHSDGFHHPDIKKSAPYDLIVMNILAEPLLRLAHGANQNLAAGGVLMLSGILATQETTLREAYLSLGLELSQRLSAGDWTALILQKA